MSKVSDNHQLDFPARMSDGRQFTDYRPNCYLNNEMGQNMGSWQYRTFLMRNATQIHKKFVDDLIHGLMIVVDAKFKHEEDEAQFKLTFENKVYNTIKTVNNDMEFEFGYK